MEGDAAAIDLNYHTHLDQKLVEAARNRPKAFSSLVRLR
jgi:hypothetical protein